MDPRDGDRYFDDPSIPNDVLLLRRIPPGQVKHEETVRRPQSDNFSNDPRDRSGTSVDILEGNWRPEDTLKGHDGFGLVAIKAFDVRALGIGVIRVPVPGNDHHAQLHGKKNRKIKRRLAELATWLKEPTP